MKQRIIKTIVGVALLLAILTGSGLAADWLGVELTPTAFACGGNSSGGGDC
jgi:predicted signal transduction protein with EAL and GGDEF domain